ncbi:MAG: FlgD immunoglobulin-like domain containing protein [Candidatus Eisenbacteria bacterium]
MARFPYPTISSAFSRASATPAAWWRAALRAPARPAVALALAISALAAGPAHALRVVTWNFAVYHETNLAGRQSNFRTVMANLNADVLIAQEINSQAGVDSFQISVLNVVEPGQWANSGFYTLQTSPTIEGGAIFYKTAKVAINFTSITATSGPRDVLFTRVTPVGYTNINGTFRLYSVHFKANGLSGADSTTRRLEATDLRTTLNGVPANTNFMIGGDTNIYGAYEGAYIRLTESQADNDGRGTDPLSLPGLWNNASYAVHHTQSACLSGCPFAGGGMDDRFDLWLGSTTLNNGQGVDIVPGGYSAYGNDGQHFDDDINGGGFNNAVGVTIATALRGASDHLPVIITVQVAARIQAASAITFGSVILGATAQQNLAVTNNAVAPADNLDYTLVSPVGFTNPGGPFSAVAAATNNHTITMLTGTVGLKAGTLTVTTDAPDSLTKPVQLSGTVLAHAVSSLDSTATVVEDSLLFGEHPAGGFTEQSVRVHNRGYNALQARLSLTGGNVTGGAGRFSILGGFSPSLIAGLGRSFEVQFNDAGATADSTYEATLTFTSEDEALPGATARPVLVLHLTARVTGGATAVLPGPRPTTLAFLPPRPNPVDGQTRFAFDLPEPAPVALEIYDLGGRRVARVVDGVLAAGRHVVPWTPVDDAGRSIAAGLYFARFQTTGLVRTHRLTILP